MFRKHFSEIGTPARERTGLPSAVGAFIFAGGHTIGVGQHFDVLAQLEDGPFGVATTRRNMPKLPVCSEVGDWVGFLADHDIGRGEVDWVYGNPPCAPFSVAGHNAKTRRRKEDKWYEKDPRTSCIHKQFFLLEALQPKVWTWESVCPAFTKGRELVDALTERALALGYSATYLFDNALDLGVAQRRLRMFCVFHNVEIPWIYPKRDPRNYATVSAAWRTAFGGGDHPDGPRAKISPKGIEYINDTMPGESMRRAWERKRNWSAEVEANWPRGKNGTILGRPGFSAIRLAYDKPSPTLLGGSTAFHPVEPRYLSVKEQQVLCSYPPDYEFVGSVQDQYSQVGKAVMPKVAEWLASNVSQGLISPRPTRGVVRIVDFIHDRYTLLKPESSPFAGVTVPITYNDGRPTTYATHL